MGFDCDSNGHRVYLPETRRIAMERNIRFDMAEVRIIGEPIKPEHRMVQIHDVNLVPKPSEPENHTV